MGARIAVRIRTHVQFSPRETRRWAEELRRSPMTVIRKCSDHATPKVFTNASKEKKGAACSASRSITKNPDSEITAPDNVWVPGLEDKGQREGQRQEQIKPAS